MRISDWSSDVCSSDLPVTADHSTPAGRELILDACPEPDILVATCSPPPYTPDWRGITSEDWRSGIETGLLSPIEFTNAVFGGMIARGWRSEEHTSELQSLMRISYAVFCLKQKINNQYNYREHDVDLKQTTNKPMI